MEKYIIKTLDGTVVNRVVANIEFLQEAYPDHIYELIPPRPADPEKLSAATRKERNQLLTESDWTQMPDAPVDQDAWATYRQALRDIPQQAGFPTDITWPTKPE